MNELIRMILDLQIENRTVEFMAKAYATEEDDIAPAKCGRKNRNPHLKGHDKKIKEWRNPHNRGANHDRHYFHGRRDERREPVAYEDDITMEDMRVIVEEEITEYKKMVSEARKIAADKVIECKACVLWALQELKQAEEDLEAIE